MNNIKNIFVVLCFIIIASVIMLLFFRFDVSEPQQNNNNAPDIIMKQVSAVQFDEKGNRQYFLSSPWISHFANKDETVFHKIMLLTSGEDHTFWRITANTARAGANFNKIDLQGNVEANELGAAQDLTQMMTNSLEVFPDKKFATTKDKIIIKQGMNSIEGIGMDANMQEGITHFKSNVKVSYSNSDPTTVSDLFDAKK